MRLVTYLDGATERVGLVENEGLVDLSSLVPDLLTLIAEAGPPLWGAIREKVAVALQKQEVLPLQSVTLLAPIPHPRKNIICLGKNYVAHVTETARARQRPDLIPDHPVFFSKATTAVNRPGGKIPYNPQVSTKIDWEVELAFIVGKQGKNINRAEAMDYIFGYTILNDFTARDLQEQHRQFYKGKGLDGMAPFGPWIVTADEIPDPHNLRLSLRVNGETMQDACTSAMIFRIPDIIAILSLGMTLEIGDLVATGTPSGVGMGMQPPRFLAPGDLVEAEVEKIGILHNVVELELST